jgi:ABC-type uncharacterized transport system involved in gliding motility auxiliary subunit
MRGKKTDERKDRIHLELRDYVALVVAFLQTTLLPILILIVVLVLFLLLIHH